MKPVSRSTRIDLQIKRFRKSNKSSITLYNLYYSEVRRITYRNPDLVVLIISASKVNGNKKFACIIYFK